MKLPHHQEAAKYVLGLIADCSEIGALPRFRDVGNGDVVFIRGAWSAIVTWWQTDLTATLYRLDQGAARVAVRATDDELLAIWELGTPKRCEEIGLATFSATKFYADPAGRRRLINWLRRPYALVTSWQTPPAPTGSRRR